MTIFLFNLRLTCVIILRRMVVCPGCVHLLKASHQSGNLPDEHVSCVVSASPPTFACVTFGLVSDRNPADETSRRFEWSSKGRARFRAASCSKLHRRESELDELSPWRADSHAVPQAKKGGTSTGSPQTSCLASCPGGAQSASRCNGDLLWIVAGNRCLRWWHRCLILSYHVRQVCPTGYNASFAEPRLVQLA